LFGEFHCEAKLRRGREGENGKRKRNFNKIWRKAQAFQPYLNEIKIKKG
jgi:hypothetical protein